MLNKWGQKEADVIGYAVVFVAYLEQPTIYCLQWEADSDCVVTARGWSADGKIIFLKFRLSTLAIYSDEDKWDAERSRKTDAHRGFYRTSS